jgi:hypothetical protein
MTPGLCNRFKSDGSTCHNVCSFEDGWCREDDCAGFVRINPVAETLRDVLARHAESAPKRQKRETYTTKVSQTNLLQVLTSRVKISVTQRALNEFKGHHGGSSDTAESSIKALFLHCLENDIDVLRDVDEEFYVLRYGRFSISVLITSMVRITSYSTLHRERTWEQVENGISSRITKKHRPRSGAVFVSQLSDEEFSALRDKLLNLHINGVYEVEIVNATNFGVFVYLACVDLQGLIHRAKLGKYSSINPLKDEIWIPGNDAQVKLDRIDLEQLRLDFSLVKYNDIYV